MASRFEINGVSALPAGGSWLTNWTPSTITSWSPQPGNLTVSKGCPGTASSATFGPGGCTLVQTGDATGHYFNTSSHEGRPLSLAMPCGIGDFTAKVTIGSMSGFGVGGETEVYLGYFRGSPEKPVCTGRLFLCYTANGASRSVFKATAGHNQGSPGTHGTATPAAPSSTLALEIQVRSGKEFKGWLTVDGGSRVEIDAGVWRAPSSPMDCAGIGTGFIVFGLGSAAAGATNQSCVVTGWEVTPG